MNPLGFNRKTFAYFEQAQQNENDRAWFDTHKQEYEEAVVVPFTHLILQMRERFAHRLSGIDLSAKRIVKPLRRQVQGLEEPIVRSKTTAFFSEPPTSMFETNPGIYISLGAAAEDNVYGVGLYDVSSRQMKQLRPAFLSEHIAADACIKSPSVIECWGGLSGARFQRFPKDYEETAPGAEYLWHKQILLSKTFTRTTATKPTFVDSALDDFATAIPFLRWLRATVGVYRQKAE